jgi:small subunit ribosomal protein S20
MANHASAIKRNRQRIRRTERNRSARSALRTTIKAARSAIAAGDKASAQERALAAEVALAAAAGKGIIKSNTAARTTSRLVKAVAKLG